MGKHSNRTPMAYTVYRRLFEAYIDFVDLIDNADVVILGFLVDLNGLSERLKTAISKNPNLKVIVISEEPLWDCLNGGDFHQKQASFIKDDYEFVHYNLNHVTTKIFSFSYIPYFITTDDNYFSRYSFLFKSKKLLNSECYKSKWDAATKRLVFYIQKRLESRYSKTFPYVDVIGLSEYRTKLAMISDPNITMVHGEGWNGDGKRQILPDWHLDKIVSLRDDCYMLSAIENTHLNNYVTEKLFDAFAIDSVPLYYAGPNHKSLGLVHPGSFLNLYNLDINEAKNLIEGFEPTTEFLENYIDSQLRLTELFGRPETLIYERLNVVSKVLAEINKIV